VAVPSETGQRREFRALVPASPWTEGVLAAESAGGSALPFRQTARRGAVAELRIEAPDAEAALEGLARAGWPALGDAARDGAPVPGPPRIRCASEPPPAEWWPDESPWLEARPDGGPISFRISREARRAIDRGHPWLRPDPDCDDPSAFAPGTLVSLRSGDGGEAAALARIEGPGEVAARVWSRGAARPRDVPSAEARVAAALAARRRLISPPPGGPVTEVFRLVHGEADGLPGWFADRIGPWLRIVVSSRVLDPLRDRLLAALRSQAGALLGFDPSVVEVLYLRPHPEGRLRSVRHVGGPPVAEPLWVRERGLEFEVESGLREPDRPRPGFGLFPDMRANRERAARHAARGRRWLNLFAHTGAFSAALLGAGAEEVVSVDLSAPYLEILERNLDRNGLLGARHRCVRGEGRRFLEGLPGRERFAGIVVDPPTAAAAGRRFWSVTRDLEPLLEQAFRHLEPGGWLLAARNDRTGRGGARRLEKAVRRAAGRAGERIARVQDAPPGPDFPRLPAFPEGDPFRAVWVQTASPGGSPGEPSPGSAHRG
jgi:23S rRNA (cytosine1962-C5)-methyltransferase